MATESYTRIKASQVGVLPLWSEDTSPILSEVPWRGTPEFGPRYTVWWKDKGAGPYEHSSKEGAGGFEDAMQILICLEQGGNWGHAAIATQLASLLREDGHEVVLAAPRRELRDSTLLKENFPRRLLAPDCVLPRAARPTFQWATFATVLWDIGFGAEGTAARLAAWRTVFDEVRPDAIICNAAPFAQLAARGRGVPRIQIGPPYDVLPPVSPLPSFRFWAPVPVREAGAFEAQFLRRLAQVAGVQDEFDSLASLINADVSLVASIPELDLYGTQHRTYVGPLPSPPTGATVSWKPGGRRRALAYVRAGQSDPQAIAAALMAHCDDVIIACPDAPTSLASRGPMRVHREFIRIDQLMAGADLIVSHGGGLMAHAAVHGIAQLVLPTHAEQVANARMLSRAGLGLVAPAGRPALFPEAIRLATTLPLLAQRTAAARTRHAGLAAQPLGLLRAALRQALSGREVIHAEALTPAAAT